ncbi:uncharacterized protein LOC118335673, partial [Tachysurus ichikawai]
MEAAFERERYVELASACTQAGWRAYTFPVEVGCRGFNGTSTQRFLKTLGVRGAKLQKALKDLAEEAEKGQGLGDREIPATAPPPRDVPGLKEQEWVAPG